MKNFFKIIPLWSLLSLWLIFSQNCFAKEQAPAPGDFINLAAVMIQDGHFDRALLALQNVDLEDDETDFIRFYTLQGLAYLSLNDLLLAKESLLKAVEYGQKDKVIYIYLAQANYGLKEYQQTIDSIEKAAEAADPYPSLIEMKAQSHWELKQSSKAINALNKGMRLFPEEFRFLRRKVFYLVELELYQEAAETGRSYLTLSQPSSQDYIAIGNALRMSRQFEQALSILEPARLQFPEETTVAKLLAYTYLDQGQTNAAAFIMEQASLVKPELTSEASELYRRAGRLYKALSLNGGVQDQKVKLKQRMAILLALKQYEKAANMESNLFRTGLLKDENIRYALAYAFFSIGKFNKVEKQLEYLKDPELFKKGVELRRIMNECQEDTWKCSL